MIRFTRPAALIAALAVLCVGAYAAVASLSAANVIDTTKPAAQVYYVDSTGANVNLLNNFKSSSGALKPSYLFLKIPGKVATSSFLANAPYLWSYGVSSVTAQIHGYAYAFGHTADVVVTADGATNKVTWDLAYDGGVHNVGSASMGAAPAVALYQP